MIDAETLRPAAPVATDGTVVDTERGRTVRKRKK